MYLHAYAFQALKAFPSSRSIQKHGCHAILMLCNGSEENTKAVNALGGWDAIVNALKAHAADTEVTCYGIRCIEKMSNSDENRQMLHKLGAPEVIIQALLHMPDNRDIALASCWTIVKICHNNMDNSKALHPACQLIVQALHKFAKDRDFVEKACMTIVTLAYSNEENTSEFIAANAHGAIVEVSC